MMQYKKIYHLYLLALSICCFQYSQFLLSRSDSLAILSSTLIALENISHKGPQESFFDNLLKKTKNVELRNSLKRAIEQIRKRSVWQQELAEYLFQLLLANKEFEQGFFSGSKFPAFKYNIGDSYLYGDYSTDLFTRILLTLNIVQDIQNNWSSADEIGIVSLGGGRLLQDFILLKALYFRGFRKINLFVVDLQNYIEDLKRVLENDKQLKDLINENSINIEHHEDADRFIRSGKKSINICYTVSPTVVLFVSKNIGNQLKNREINFIRIGALPQKQIKFYFPFDVNDAFVKSFEKTPPILEQLNQYLLQGKEASFAYVFDALEKSGVKFAVTDDIMLDFYDIIKSSSLQHCFGYMAFQDTITSYYNVKEQPYWALNYNIVGKSQGEAIFIYDPNKKQFEPLN